MKEYFNHLSECRDFDAAIIKGHILTEYALERFIEQKSIEKVNIQDAKFSYSVKLEVSKILGLSRINKSLYDKLKLLNKLRNSIAHKLKYDEATLNEFLKGFDNLKSEFDDEMIRDLKKDTLIAINVANEDSYKIRGQHLMFVLQVCFMCGYITGTLEA